MYVTLCVCVGGGKYLILDLQNLCFLDIFLFKISKLGEWKKN